MLTYLLQFIIPVLIGTVSAVLIGLVNSYAAEQSLVPWIRKWIDRAALRNAAHSRRRARAILFGLAGRLKQVSDARILVLRVERCAAYLAIALGLITILYDRAKEQQDFLVIVILTMAALGGIGTIFKMIRDGFADERIMEQSNVYEAIGRARTLFRRGGMSVDDIDWELDKAIGRDVRESYNQSSYMQRLSALPANRGPASAIPPTSSQSPTDQILSSTEPAAQEHKSRLAQLLKLEFLIGSLLVVLPYWVTEAAYGVAVERVEAGSLIGASVEVRAV